MSNVRRLYICSRKKIHFNGRYQYMRVLKYFIWKEEKKVDSEGVGHIEEVSDLAAFIENAGQEKQLREDWMSNMVWVTLIVLCPTSKVGGREL